ncbi:hypothetical protein Acr_24g0017400 [Actinidia rufa]|uniref:Uncharacterized protein n=1 Tax=Actinidia rufa TaxID=165716 RepID=A0A7J0GXJ8_9ERIC|nr:hypothetical protein Acr_24g0017400 [Actinidia rufa]
MLRRKAKSVGEIMGEVTKKGNRGKSQDGGLFLNLMNRNRLILNEAQATWSLGKSLGLPYERGDDEVISRFMELDESDAIHTGKGKQCQNEGTAFQGFLGL